MTYAGPYADIHRHGEANAWLDAVLAESEGRPPRFHRERWLEDLAAIPPGPSRLAALQGPMPNDQRNRYLDEPFWSNLVLERCLGQAAASGALVTEIRVGMNASITPGFPARFQAAVATVRERTPVFSAVAVLSGVWPSRPGAEEAIEACLQAGPSAFAGVDFIPFPYERATDWERTYRHAERLADAGFGITVHAGEFSPTHLAPALETPGISRIGHGTSLAKSGRLLQGAMDRGVVLECCITSNVLLGAIASAEVHPVRRFVDAGAQVALCTDNPARFGNTIVGEYRLAATLGLSDADLGRCTATAITASFLPDTEKESLLQRLRE